MSTLSASDIYKTKQKEYKINDDGTEIFQIRNNDRISVFARDGVTPTSISTGRPNEITSISRDEWDRLSTVSIFKTSANISLGSLKLLVDNLPNLKVLKVRSFEIEEEKIQELATLLSKIEYLTIVGAFSAFSEFGDTAKYTVTLPALKCFIYLSNFQVPTLDFKNCVLFYFSIQTDEESVITIIPHKKNTTLINHSLVCKFIGFDYLTSLQTWWDGSLPVQDGFANGLGKLRNIYIQSTETEATCDKFIEMCRYLAEQLPRLSDILILRHEVSSAGFIHSSVRYSFEKDVVAGQPDYMIEYALLKKKEGTEYIPDGWVKPEQIIEWRRVKIEALNLALRHVSKETREIIVHLLGVY
jgi:hypothetical protein